MKKTILVVLILTCSFVNGQDTVEKYVKQGIEHHDNKKFDKAIQSYKKALEIDKNSALANYEIALSYSSKQDYENAIKYSDKVIKHGKKHLIPAYLIKGSSLDLLGKTKESIKIFKKAIKKHGDHYLLYYNLAINQYKIKEYKKAEENTIKAILNNQSHTSSHLLLATIQGGNNQKVQALLSLYYFLLLEPDSYRADDAYTSLLNNLGSNVSQDKDNPNNINILLNLNPKSKNEFSAAELMISLLGAKRYTDENKDKTDEELFVENTKSFFTVLEELKKNNSKGIYWELYIPFFYDLAKSDHIETYCHYISQIGNTISKEWIDANPKKLEEFDSWLKGH